MLFACIGLFLVAVIICVKDYKTESTRWLALICFFVGLGSLSVVLNDTISVYSLEQGTTAKYTWVIIYLKDIFSNLSNFTTPSLMLIYGVSYSNIIKKNKKVIYGIILIPSIICFMVFPIRRNSISANELKLYFEHLAIWAAPFIFSGVFFIVYSFANEPSYLVKKHKFINMIMVAPFFSYCAIVNYILRAFGADHVWRIYPIIFAFHVSCFIYFAIKYGVFGVRLKFHKHVLAFEDILQIVSDSVLVLDKNLNLIQINNSFTENFLANDKKYNNFDDIVDCSKLIDHKNKLLDLIHISKYNMEVKSDEIMIMTKSNENFFEVQTNPIIFHDEYFGIVILFKNITLYRKSLELIKQNQFQVIERERLLSLNQLIGGISHNLKTPLLSSSGGIQVIKKDIAKLYNYIEDEYINIDQIKKLMDEINDWGNRISGYLIYMSDVINSVKGQVKEFEQVEEEKFSIGDIINKTLLLMDYEFKKYKCTIIKEIDIDYGEIVKGNIDSLIQVLNIFLTNAIEASDYENDKIIILGSYKKENTVTFYVKNFGNEISLEVQKNIFKKMVTTKGINGTGLGLYIAKSIINGRLKGEIYYETNVTETTFYVNIPLV